MLDTTPWRKCRFCGRHESALNLLKYGVRHYAHYRCYLAGGGTLAALTAWQVSRFPAGVLRIHGVADEAARIVANAKGA